MNEKNILNLLFKNDKNKPKIEKIEFNVDYDKNYDVFYNDFEYEFEDNMKKFLIQKIDKENYYKNVFIKKENEKNDNFKIKNNLYKKLINLDEEYFKYNQKIINDPFAINLHEILRIPYEIQIRKINKNYDYNNNNKRENNFNRNKNNFNRKKNHSYINNNNNNNNEFNNNPLINYSYKRNKSSHKKYY
jgi:hypothetical protein